MSKICVQRRDNRESCLMGISMIGNRKSGRNGIVGKSMNEKQVANEVQSQVQEFSAVSRSTNTAVPTEEAE